MYFRSIVHLQLISDAPLGIFAPLLFRFFFSYLEEYQFSPHHSLKFTNEKLCTL